MPKIVINAGHFHDPAGGKTDSGATYGSFAERDLMIAIRDKIKDRFPQYAYVPDNLNLFQSIEWANDQEPVFALDLHCNSSINKDVRGVETYYGDNKEEAQAFSLYLSRKVPLVNRGARHQSESAVKTLAWINQLTCPSLLLELGYLSSPYDRSMLTHPVAQRKIAKAVGDMANNYLNARRLAKIFPVRFQTLLDFFAKYK